MKFLDCLFRWFGCSKIISEKDLKVNQLKNELQGFTDQKDYLFIPTNWKEVSGSVVTKKTQQNGIDLEWDIRDLLNSTIYSRNLADEIIGNLGYQLEDKNDIVFNKLCLESANLIIAKIKYKTNQDQFNVIDRWNNGDTAIVTGEGDCDLSVRVFVRVMNDILDKLKMFEYKKYIFQAIGFYHRDVNTVYGHSWAIVFDPIDKQFKLIECTLDNPYSYLPSISSKYDMYFCLNFKKVFNQNKGWKTFL